MAKDGLRVRIYLEGQDICIASPQAMGWQLPHCDGWLRRMKGQQAQKSQQMGRGNFKAKSKHNPSVGEV